MKTLALFYFLFILASARLIANDSIILVQQQTSGMIIDNDTIIDQYKNNATVLNDTSFFTGNNNDTISTNRNIIKDVITYPIKTAYKGGSKLLDFATTTMDRITEYFMGCDTNYITPQLYEFTAQLELSSWNDYYHMRSSVTNNTMTIKSETSMIMGGNIYWGIFGYGYMVNLRDLGVTSGETNGTSRRHAFTINTGRFFGEYYTFNSGKLAKITDVSNMDLKGIDTRYRGLDSWCNGLNIMYILNHNKYSWPAAFGENAVQRKSCGSWKVGISYNHQKITMNTDELPAGLANIDTTLLFNRIDYSDYAISVGYGYNAVLRRNCLFAISIMPALGYRKSNVTESQQLKFRLRNISTDVFTRASLFWNNTRYFSGIIFELHTYHYRQKKLGLTNNYGTIKYIVGLNFLKKAKYRKKKQGD